MERHFAVYSGYIEEWVLMHKHIFSIVDQSDAEVQMLCFAPWRPPSRCGRDSLLLAVPPPVWLWWFVPLGHAPPSRADSAICVAVHHGRRISCSSTLLQAGSAFPGRECPLQSLWGDIFLCPSVPCRVTPRSEPWRHRVRAGWRSVPYRGSGSCSMTVYVNGLRQPVVLAPDDLLRVQCF